MNRLTLPGVFLRTRYRRNAAFATTQLRISHPGGAASGSSPHPRHSEAATIRTRARMQGRRARGRLRSLSLATGAATIDPRSKECQRATSCEGAAMHETQPDLSLAEARRTHILQTLIHCRGNRTQAARRLGISIRCLRDKLRCFSEAGIEIPGPPAADDGTDTAHLCNFDGAR